MKLTIICLILTSLLWAIACTEGSESPRTAPTDFTEPTPNVQATVEAGVAATTEADQSIESTITARVEATKKAGASPNPTTTHQLPPMPTVAPTAVGSPAPTLLPTILPTPIPTPFIPTTLPPTPTPHADSEELLKSARLLFDCLQENEEFKQIYVHGATFGATSEGMTQEGAADLVNYLLSSQEFFVLAYIEGVADDPSAAALLETELEGCEATLGGQLQPSEPPDFLSVQLYECILRNEEFREEFREGAVSGAAESGMTHDGAIDLVNFMLSSGDFFLLSMREAAKDDPLFAEELELALSECLDGFATNRPTDPELEAYADRHAGGPGAIYVGDLGQLAGPAVTDDFISAYGADLGDYDGNVPLFALNQHRWIFESDYYLSLLEKARLTDPATLTSRGERIRLRHTCINRQLLWCKHLEAYFIPNVEDRSNGQIIIDTTSFPELGLAGSDTALYLADGRLEMSEVYGGYVASEFPVLEMQYLWGLWPDHQTHFNVQASIADDIDGIISEGMGSRVLMRNWIAGDDQFIFSDERLTSVEDFRGLRTRSHSARLSDWLNGMGAQAQFMAFAEVYSALEQSTLDAGVTGANPGLAQRWYEVIDYMNGPLIGFNSTMNAINDNVWIAIPRDLQQILIEEGAKHELEALRLAAIQNLTGLQRNIDAGLAFVEFNSEVRQQAFVAAYDNVLPEWLRHLGYPASRDETVALFNEHAGTHVGLRIERDGSVVQVPITAGPHAGKTMEQVLAE